jgi:hypothetical protein
MRLAGQEYLLRSRRLHGADLRALRSFLDEKCRPTIHRPRDSNQSGTNQRRSSNPSRRCVPLIVEHMEFGSKVEGKETQSSERSCFQTKVSFIL